MPSAEIVLTTSERARGTDTFRGSSGPEKHGMANAVVATVAAVVGLIEGGFGHALWPGP